ncbi:twitching motility protein (pilT) [Anaplasma bovis]|uniref:twitching motility protein (pilT) n=1 Tax=Anaplasma bovis TaxID=186733 RepID=UPI002FF3E9B4
MEYFRQLISASLMHNASHVYFVADKPTAIRVLGRLEFLQTRKNSASDIEALLSAVLSSASDRKAFDSTGSAEVCMEFDPLHTLRIRVIKELSGIKIVVHIKKQDFPSEENLPQKLLQVISSPKPGMLFLGGAFHHNKDATLSALLKLIGESHKFHVLVFGVEFSDATSHEGSLISYYSIEQANIDLIRFQAPDIVVFKDVDPEIMKVARECVMFGTLVMASVDSISHACTILRILSLFSDVEVGKRFLCESMLGMLFQVLLTKASEPSFYLYDFLEMSDNVRQLIMCDNIRSVGNVQMVQQLNSMVEKGILEYYDIHPVLCNLDHLSSQQCSSKDTDAF